MRVSLKSWRFLVLFVAAVVALAAFAACGEDEEAPGGGGEPAPPEQQKLVMHSTEPQYFDPHRSNFEQDIAIERMLFRGLYQLQATEEGGVEAVPAMADGDPQVSADGKTFTVKLKSGLKWSDGQPLTAQQFEDGIKRGCDPIVASPYAYLLMSGAEGGIIGVKGCDEYQLSGEQSPAEQEALRDAMGVKAIDDQTLEITLVEAKLPLTFKQIFSLWITFPARLDVIERFGEKWTDPGNIVGNGPFTLTEFVPKDHVTLKPNPDWALEPKPKLQQLTIRFIDDYGVAFRAFQTGELDEARIPEAQVPTAQGDPNLKDKLLIIGSVRITSVEVQMKNDVIKKDKVRLALSKAIDRDTLVQVANSGVGLPAEYWLVQGLSGFQGRDKFKSAIGYDPEGAKQALADAGYPNGQGFPKLKLTILNTPARQAQAEFLQRNWKSILGIDVEIQAVDGKTRSQLFNSQNFELFIGGWQLDYPDVENPLVGLFNTGGGNNMYNCSDPEIDQAFQDAGAAKSESDHIKGYQKVEQLVVTKLCGAIPYLQEALPYLISPKIGGVNANGTIDAAQPGNWCAECWFVKK